MLICAASLSVSHQSPNSSVCSTGHSTSGNIIPYDEYLQETLSARRTVPAALPTTLDAAAVAHDAR